MHLMPMENIVTAHDLTNPRELYNILSRRTKSAEDLAFILNRELFNGCQCSGALPALVRTLSMSDIDQATIKDLGLGNKLSHVGTVDHNQNKYDMLILNRHKSCAEELNRSEENKENLGTANLPQLNKQAHRSGDTNKLDGRREREDVLVELPRLPCKRNMANGNVELQQHLNKNGLNRHLSRVREELSVSDSKLHKWFSEMPNEVFDKAQRALMEESIKEKLGEYQRNRNRKMSFPNKSVHVWLGSGMKKVPNSYLELKVDSFGRQLQSDDKLSKYKLQQKSLHNLKMRDTCETERQNREDNLPRLSLQHRSLTTLALSKTKPKVDRQSKDDKGVIKIPTERALTTVYMNDTFEPDENNLRIKQRHSVSNFEEYRERLNLMKEAQEIHRSRSDKSRANSPPPNTMIDDFEQSNGSSSLERDTTKAAIVNLSLKKEAPRSRKPQVLEKSSKDNMETDRHATLLGKSDRATAHTGDCGLDQIDGAGPDIGDQKYDPLVTKIPTAQSNRTPESKSSSTSQNSTKAALKKFNTLEVFAEHGKPQQINIKKEPKLRNPDGLRGIPLPPSLKLDTKLYGMSGAHTMREPLHIPTDEVKKQDVMFRFEPGEVFITRKSSNQFQNHARSSERARVIYGKIVNQQRDWHDRKDPLHKSKEDLRDSTSLVTASTKVDGFRSELSRFENRAIDGSMTSYSSRHDDGAYNNMLVIGSRSNTMFDSSTRNLSTMDEIPSEEQNKRDVATETDVLGSAKVKGKAGKCQDTNNTEETPASSGLSGYIVENNDGESLLSDAESHHGYKSGHSV